MATIVKRQGKKGVSWQVKVKGADGVQCSLGTFATEADALDAEAAYRLEQRGVIVTAAPEPAPAPEPVVSDAPRFDAWVEQCMAEWRHNAASSIYTWNGKLRKHWSPRFGSMRIDAITREHVERAISELYDAGLKPATVQSIFDALSKVMQHGVARGKLDSACTVGVKLRKRRRSPKVFLTPEQVELLADGAAVEYRAAVYVSAYCGLRPGELFVLRWSDIDFGHVDLDGVPCTVLRIERTLTRDARGNREADVPKTDNARRVVPVPTGIVLDELLLYQTRSGGTGDGLVFPDARSGELFTHQAYDAQAWRPALRASTRLAAERGVRALPAGLTPHKLRHTAVALWIKAGAEPLEVSKRAGHAGIAYTYDNYGGLFADRARVLDRALDGLARAARSEMTR